MNHDKRRGRLRLRLTLLLVVAVTVPLGAGTFAVRTIVGQSLEEGVYNYHASVIGELSAAIEADVGTVLAEVQRVGQALAAADPREAETAVLALLGKAASVDHVALYTPDGTSRVAMLAKESATHTPTPESLTGALAVSPTTPRTPRLGRVSAGRWPVVVPFVLGDELAGWVYTAVDVRFLVERMATLAEARYPGVKDAILVVDEDGALVGASAGLTLPEPLRALFPTRDGGASFGNRIEKVAAYADPSLGGPAFARIGVLPKLRVAVVTRQSEAEAFAALHRVTTIALVALGALFVLALLAAWILARRATRPIDTLVAGVDRIAHADFNARVTVDATDEVAILADAINKMAADLGSYEAKLVAETQLRTSVSRYVSKDVVDLIARGEASLELGGKRQMVTVVFIDIVSFTPLSEQFPPEKLVTVVNAMFTMMTAVVWKYGGTVDKFIGDCMMTVFGSPTVRPDDAARAALAMREILNSMGEVNALAERVFGRKLQLTCGMNTGEAIVGNVGSEQRMEYTVIGDTVNVAARIQAQAAHDQILVSLATHDAILGCGVAVPLIDRGERKVKGKAEPVRIFEVPLTDAVEGAP